VDYTFDSISAKKQIFKENIAGNQIPNSSTCHKWRGKNDYLSTLAFDNLVRHTFKRA